MQATRNMHDWDYENLAYFLSHLSKADRKYLFKRTDSPIEKRTKMANLADKISPHFYLSEVACRDRNRTLPTGTAMASAERAAELMERIRSYLGDRAITVNSWYRTPAWNRQVGGAKNSLHMKGMAVDFSVEDMTPKQVYAKLLKARASGAIAIGGLGLYRGWVHADTGKVRTWKG